MSMSRFTSLSLRVKAPRRRFSRQVMSAMIRRPSITWKMPRRTIWSGLDAVEALAAEADVAARDLAFLGLQQAGDGLQRGGLAGAVGAEQGDDLALRHRQRQAAQHEDDVVVDDLDVVDLEQRRLGGVRPRRRACCAAVAHSPAEPVGAARQVDGRRPARARMVPAASAPARVPCAVLPVTTRADRARRAACRDDPAR